MTRVNRGFSLVELMVVVAIIGVLSSIAIPRMHEMSLKAKRAEAAPNMDGVAIAELAYNSAYDTWTTTDFSHWPLGKDGYAWDPTVPGWDILDFRPDGLVRCGYMVAVISDHHMDQGALCDIDGDGEFAELRQRNYDDGRPSLSEDVYPYNY